MLFEENAGPVLEAKGPASEPAEGVAWSYVRGECGPSNVSMLYN